MNGNELLSPLSVTIPSVEKMDYIQNKEKFDAWYYSEPRDQDRIPVATIQGKLADLIGANSFVVWLSGWTAKKQLDRHPDITFEDYTLLN